MLRQVEIYREAGRYAGWPANYGMWHWGDEIVVGFTLGYHKAEERFHTRDKRKPFVNMQARSRDGGKRWQIEAFNGQRPGGRGLSADEHLQAGLRLGELMDGESVAKIPPQPLSFKHPDFALMMARTGLARGSRSFFYVSYDRCRHWQGPYHLPMFAQTGIAARTDYLVQGEHSCLLFLTASKSNGHEGKILCVRTQDGGMSFELLAEIGGEPGGERDFAIMPASLQLAKERILCAVRCRDGAEGKAWIDLYASDNLGKSWAYLNRPVMFRDLGHGGNPPSLQQLPDGRLILIYGNRDEPYTICARLSADEGESWSDAIPLREGGGNHDIGYTRAVVLADGTVVSVYYFNDRPDGERFIEATIWQPALLSQKEVKSL